MRGALLIGCTFAALVFAPGIAAAQFPHGVDPEAMYGTDGRAAREAGGILNDATSFAGWVNTAIQAAENFADFTDGYRHLNEGDSEFDPDYSPDGSPEVPISCETEECMQCYARSVERLNFVRFQLERLRAIYASTQKMAQGAIAFGDTTSGIHAMTGLAWQSSRRGIQQQLEKLGRTYDEKYEGMMGTLRSALQQMAECEREHFDNPDWYNRFGFIYYTFMADRYKRAG
jgi:hypothetical protein